MKQHDFKGSKRPFPDIRRIKKIQHKAGVIDECNDAHGSAAVQALEWIDLVDFLNQPGPVGLASCVSSRFVDGELQ